MDFTSVEEFKEGIIIRNVKNFDLTHIFQCGQCFRWNKQKHENYIGVAFNKVIEVEKKDEDVYLYNTNLQEFNKLWIDYFDLKRNYTEIKEKLGQDEILKKAVEFGSGIRILQQEPFELLVTFIISANNRIPMIRKSIESISRLYGEELSYKGNKYYSFPSIEALNNASIEELEACGTGFRAKYIKDSVALLYNKQYNLNDIKSKTDDECHKELQAFNGVGPKVADCIMLFSMGKYSAFPVDIWVKRAMIYFYVAPDVSLKKIRDFGRERFGSLAGFAQQFLFYYARENKIEI